MKRAEKKRTLKEAIYRAAMNEFFENGYKDASMREIARQVNMTVGNLYCYYDSKADIFDALVKDVYEQIADYLNNGTDLIIRSLGLDDPAFREVVRVAADLLDQYRRNVFILLNKSKGTKYENVKQDFVAIISANYRNIIESFEKSKGMKFQGNKELTAYLSGVFFVEGLIEIVLKYENREWGEKAILDLLRLQFAGLNGFYA